MDNALFTQLKQSEIITYAGEKSTGSIRTYGYTANDFIENLLKAQSFADIHRQCALICEHYGFDFFALGAHIRRPNQSPLFFRMVDYVNTFVVHYEQHKYILEDPGVRIATQRTTPYTITNDINSFGESFRIADNEWGVLRDAVDFGIREVFYAPFHASVGGYGLARFLYHEGGRAEIKERKKPFHIQAELFLISSFIHESVMRLLVVEGEENLILTEREKQVLQLVAAGHNPSRIGDTLLIAENTVSNHLKNIRLKLGVKNTTHAVAKALSEHLIIV